MYVLYINCNAVTVSLYVDKTSNYWALSCTCNHTLLAHTRPGLLEMAIPNSDYVTHDIDQNH